MHMLTHKRLVTVTLDIMCYDDLPLEDVNWREVLELDQGKISIVASKNTISTGSVPVRILAQYFMI